MSQKKVDKYKQTKYHRAEAQRKARLNSLIRRSVVSVVAVALVIWIGFSVVDNWMESRPRQMVEINFQAIDDYMENLAADME